jgi:DMSO/TMAO reductase YedYZ molybdopterin-dependent catalytic subunit
MDMSKLKELDTPIFYAEGIPKGVTRDNFQLVVDGLIEENEKNFSFEEIENMPITTENVRLTSVSGWTVRANWQGVRFMEFLNRLKLKPTATHVNFESFGGYTTCLPLEELKKENVLLCYKVDDEYLEMEYGAPLRMLIPHKWGYKSIKGLSRITFTDRQIPGYWETRGYADEAEIEPGRILDINSGQVKRIRGGEVTEF